MPIKQTSLLEVFQLSPPSVCLQIICSLQSKPLYNHCNAFYTTTFINSARTAMLAHYQYQWCKIQHIFSSVYIRRCSDDLR